MAGGHTANLAAQFNDIGLMLASGQSPLMLAMQQGTQVNQVLSQMGTGGVSRLGALKTAFMSVIQPANLVTFAIIAGGAALVQWGIKALSAGRETRTLEDAMEGLSDVAGRATRAANILTRTTEDLREEYGDLADQIRQAALEALEFAAAQSRINFETAIREIRGLAASLEWWYEELRLSGDQSEVAAEQARTLQYAFRDLRTATTAAGQTEAFEHIMTLLDEMNIDVATLGAEFVETGTALTQMKDDALQLENAFRRVAEGAADVGEGAAVSAEQVNLLRDAFSKGEEGGEAFNRDQLAAELARLQESFMAEEELQLLAYERQHTMLEEALERKLLTQQQYEDLMRRSSQAHNDAMNGIEMARYAAALGTMGDVFSSMAGLFQNSNKKMLQIARVFGAAQALISTYQGAAEALKLPFPMNLAAAASVISAGLGFVASIKSVTAGGGGGGGGRGLSAAGAGGSAPQAAQSVSRNVAIQLEGEIFSADAVRNLINKINEAVEDGAKIRLV